MMIRLFFIFLKYNLYCEILFFIIFVSFSQVQMVTRVAVQGKEWDLVEGYYLWYSQDGKQWKAYSESGDKLEANVRVVLLTFPSCVRHR